MPPKASPPNPKARPAGASVPSARKTAASKPNSAVRPKPGAVSVASKQNPSQQTAPSPGKKPPINKTGPAAVTSEDQEVAELKDMFTAKGTISSVPEAAAAADPGPRGSAAEGAMKSRRTSTSKKDAVQLPPEQDPLDENLERLSTAMDAFISQADEREKEVASLKERNPLGIALAAKTKTGRASDLMKRLDVEGDGNISKVEWRRGIKEVGLVAEDKECDELFASLNEDGSGEMNTSELKAALQKLQDTVDLTNKEIERNGKEARYLQTKASLMKVAIDALAEAKQTVTAAKATTDALPLESKVANGLESQKLLKDAKALFKKWDPNGKGVIKKNEFRQHVWALVPDAHFKQVDELFAAFDRKKAGELTLAEIQSAATRLQSAAEKASKEVSKALAVAEERTQAAREKETTALELLDTEDAARSEDDKLVKMEEDLPLVVRIGREIVGVKVRGSGGVKANDQMRIWDFSGDGLISRAEFSKEIKLLGIASTPEEEAALFNQLDSDGSGFIDLGELKVGLKRVEAEYNAANKEKEKLKMEATKARKKVAQLTRAATAALPEAAITAAL